MQYILYILGKWIVTTLPLSLAYQFGQILSDFQYFCAIKDRKIVRENLLNIYANRHQWIECRSKIFLKNQVEAQKDVREVFRNFGRYLVEFFRMKGTISKQYISKHFKVINRERLDHIFNSGKGGIILTAHVGNWELGAVVLSALGYPISVIALPHKRGSVNTLFNEQREYYGIEVISSTRAIRQGVEALRNNRFLAIVSDRSFTNHGEVLDFLGKKSIIPKGAATFSLKSGCPVIPVFCERTRPDYFTLSIAEPIYPPTKFLKSQTSLHKVGLMQKHISVLESKIMENPTQWLMFQRYWVNQ